MVPKVSILRPEVPWFNVNPATRDVGHPPMVDLIEQ